MGNKESLLIDGLKKCGLKEEAIPTIAEKMETYINEIILFNSAYNLTNTSDHDELVIRHILDSYAGYKKIAELAENLKTLGIDVIVSSFLSPLLIRITAIMYARPAPRPAPIDSITLNAER